MIHVGVVICLGFIVTAAGMGWTLPTGGASPDRLRANLAAHLYAHHGVVVRPADIVLPGSGGPGLTPREVFFLGRRSGDASSDVYFAHAVHSSDQVPVHTSPVFSLSRTKTASEGQLSYDSRRFLAYTSRVRGKTSVITVLDLQGLSPRATEAFTPLQRLQQRLTN